MRGWPTLVGTLPETEPHIPGAIHISRPTRSMFSSTSWPLPMRVAPRTGHRMAPFFLQNIQLNSPVRGLTLPPPMEAASRPSPMVRTISSGSSCPGAMKVLVMREVGAKV